MHTKLLFFIVFVFSSCSSSFVCSFDFKRAHLKLYTDTHNVLGRLKEDEQMNVGI